MDVNLLRKRVGMVFQKPNPFPMSVYDNIAYGPRTHGIRSKAKARRHCGAFFKKTPPFGTSLKTAKEKRAGLSGGTAAETVHCTRVGCGAGGAADGRTTSALDPISTSKIEDLAVELKKDYTIVMVTHNMQQAARISDKTAFFLLGEVIEYGETESLFSMPKDKRTEDYITGRFG